MKKHIAAEQKMEIVLAVLRKEETISKIARKHQVSEQSIYRWQEEFIAAGKGALSTRGKTENNEILELRKRIEEQERVIGEYAFATSFLKKKMGHPLST